MRRITADEVVRAYEKTGKRPARGAYVRGDCACAIGVICIAAGVDEEAIGQSAAEDLGYERFYTTGVISGFDGEPLKLFGEEYEVGYADGLAAARAVFGEGGGGNG